MENLNFVKDEQDNILRHAQMEHKKLEKRY
jgi:hypothetical protein